MQINMNAMHTLMKLKKNLLQNIKKKLTNTVRPQSVIDYIFNDELQEKLSDLIFIKTNVLMVVILTRCVLLKLKLVFCHSRMDHALFTRGNTQALASVTLGQRTR